MSEDYFPACFDCRMKYRAYFASASGFYRMHTPFRDVTELDKFERWLGEHERHDVRIVWEQDDLPGETDDPATWWPHGKTDTTA